LLTYGRRRRYKDRQKNALVDRQQIHFLFFYHWRYKKFNKFMSKKLFNKRLNRLISFVTRVEFKFENFVLRLFPRLSAQNVIKLINRGDFWVLGRRLNHKTLILKSYDCWGVNPLHFLFYIRLLYKISS
jgi:hypothetical protein